MDILRDMTGSDEVGVGIKRELLGIETARQAQQGERAERFAGVVAGMIASSRG